ncbi:MAG TPA: nucleoside 2-deoxyribosyltransferase [Aestuariivirga sp.]|nr:nucleoside 2-deoxyribosyltransferase [Aestuariivirga sp.]
MPERRISEAWAPILAAAPGSCKHPKTGSGWDPGLAISRIDEHLMNSVDAIILNLTPFRGIAADTGKCFELGYVCAGQGGFRLYQRERRQWRAHPPLLCRRGDARQRRRGARTGRHHDRDHGFCHHLMLHGGVVNRGGVVVVGDAAADRLYTEMEAFKSVLALAAITLR